MNGDILYGWQMQIRNVAATKEEASVVTWSTYHDGTNASVFIKHRTLPKQYKKYDYISQYLLLFDHYYTSFDLVYQKCEITKIKIIVFWNIKLFSLVVTYHSYPDSGWPGTSARIYQATLHHKPEYSNLCIPEFIT